MSAIKVLIIGDQHCGKSCLVNTSKRKYCGAMIGSEQTGLLSNACTHHAKCIQVIPNTLHFVDTPGREYKTPEDLACLSKLLDGVQNGAQLRSHNNTFLPSSSYLVDTQNKIQYVIVVVDPDSCVDATTFLLHPSYTIKTCKMTYYCKLAEFIFQKTST